MPKSLLRTLSAVAAGGLVAIGSAAAAPQDFETRRPDGSTVSWSLDRPTEGMSALVVIAQGSGCDPAVSSANIAAARAAFSGYATLIVEKYGVTAGDRAVEDPAACPAAFKNHFTLSQRVTDYALILAELRGQPWWNGRLGLVGGSEGGLAMARLSAEVPAEAVILLSTGGGVTFGEMVKQSMPAEGWPEADKAFAAARAHPDSSELWAGHTYRFWADAIDHRAADDMLRSRGSILLIQGGRDQSGGPAVARSVSDIFAQAGRPTLTYWEFPAYDHGMVAPDGSNHMPDVLHQAVMWLDARMSRATPGAVSGDGAP